MFNPYEMFNVVGNNVDYTIDILEELKEQTKIGNFIKFRTETEEIYGVVTEKYSFIFRLDNGRYYTWVEYMIGYIY